MAKKKKPDQAHDEESTPTGFYFACPLGAPALHVHPRPLAIAIMRGPKSYWVKCDGCGFRAYLGRYWKASFGLTAQEASAKGFLLLTLVTKKSD